MQELFKIKLLDVKMITHKVKHFTFEIVDNIDFKYKPGQFVTLFLRCRLGASLKRSYSIANFKTKKNILEISITYIQGGVGTDLLHDLKIGDSITAAGPFGRLVLKENPPARYIFMGTGTGIVPYRSMLKDLEKKLLDKSHSCIIIEGIKYKKDVLYAEDFSKLCTYSNYKFLCYFSKEEKQNLDSSCQFAGHVQKSFDMVNPNPETDIVYLCGNPFMIKDTATLLLDLKFNPEQIVTERYFSRF